MKVANIPFNISYLDNKNQRIAGLLPVKVLDIYDNLTNDFHDLGLYSNLIFGRMGTPERNKRHGYINLRCQVLHPKTFEELGRLGSLYTAIMQGSAYATWDDKEKDFVRADILTGSTGYAFFMKHFDEIQFHKNKSHRRGLRVDLINKYRSQSKIHFFIVLPAGLRDIRNSETGRPIEEDINGLYRKILIAANGIPDTLSFKEDPMLNSVRWSIQNNIQNVWKTILGVLGGKTGFLQGKWASRRSVHGTRNVITAMDPSTDVLGGERSFDNSTTIVGLNQTLRGIEPIIVRYEMTHQISDDLISNIDGEVSLVNEKTLKAESVHVSEKERVRWGTVDGRVDLLNSFSQKENRHLPIKIEGRYLKLIHQDDTGFKLLGDIDELPEGKDRSLVRPLTWAEYFYILVAERAKRIRCNVTRYPITGIESNYPSVPYVKTTVESLQLHEYNEQFEIDDSSTLYLEFPRTRDQLEFMDTTAPHVTQLVGLGADFDGDVVSVQFVMSDEAVKEIDDKLNEPSHYLTISGDLHQSAGNATLNWVYANFSGF